MAGPFGTGQRRVKNACFLADTGTFWSPTENQRTPTAVSIDNCRILLPIQLTANVFELCDLGLVEPQIEF